jgi:DNA invertase Pin-like site-specific DNA recombinase
MLKERGIELIAADKPDSFLDNGPTVTLIRQVLGAVSQFEKTMLVLKLRGARERRKAITGKCGGRKSHAELNPELVALARQLRRRRPKGGQRSLREIAAELAARGHFNERGQPFSAASNPSRIPIATSPHAALFRLRGHARSAQIPAFLPQHAGTGHSGF